MSSITIAINQQMMLKLVEIVKNGNSNKHNTNNSNSKPVIWDIVSDNRIPHKGRS